MILFGAGHSTYKTVTSLAAVTGIAVLVLLAAPICCWSASRSLSGLVKTAGALPAILSLSPGTWDVPADLEVPGTVRLELDGGATIAVAAGKTLILHGVLNAPASRIFTGAGSVNFDGDASQRVYPQWWGAKGDGVTEDTAALQAAVNSFSNKGGEIFIPDGTYVVDSVAIKSNIAVTGNSRSAILKQKKGAQCCISTNPNNAKTNFSKSSRNNIKFTAITFQGTVDSDGFSEFLPLLDIRGAMNVSVSKCNFIGFRGDGIYIGETGTRKEIYHNSKITISECIFDGVNKDNRNGVSVIDGEDIVIDKCMFKNMSRPDMPGAIDLEPNKRHNILKNIRISQNKFDNIGGSNIIQVSIPEALGSLDNAMQHIEITNNVIRGDGKQNGIYVGQRQFADDGTPPNNVLISDNVVANTKRSFMIFGVKDVRLTNNIFEECRNDPYISYSDKNINVRDMKVTGNTFRNLSKDDGAGISIFGTYNLEFKDNTFDNIGKADGTFGNALHFRRHGGAAEYVTIENNTFKGRNTKVAVQRENGNITFPEHNRVGGNTFLGSDKVLLPARLHADK